MEIKLVTVLSLFRCAAAGALGLLIASVPLTLAAQAPTPQELQGVTASGSYLAARHAGQQRDAGAAAAYYRSALRTDPKNSELLTRAFLAFLIDGEV
ncbi:MAG: tetratricopeptide repeat protein, partial [Pseudolabrys sp.]